MKLTFLGDYALWYNQLGILSLIRIFKPGARQLYRYTVHPRLVCYNHFCMRVCVHVCVYIPEAIYYQWCDSDFIILQVNIVKFQNNDYHSR